MKKWIIRIALTLLLAALGTYGLLCIAELLFVSLLWLDELTS
ncbi:hypothetical protein FHS18_003975 [Paenibacillus phyllosphaerae]|uniref:Uncharacterized protein n=1 Tax=Paenibacillus phyllosphaerae TaxID=274593 RepID=A0A7W5B003_9BACL|nr:hypothetical protein [Paenibacillus phyllosphaerae]MBB3111907.1 hypothetical protein [Paenibacillus phyllosphaerae]